MPKVTLDMSTFKALASDTRLQILRTLDGKKMNLQEISRVTKLNKATLHEHLQKLHEAGLVKKNEREGHKWVYYKLSWKGEGLLHPENTRIVVMFTATFVALAVGIIQLIKYVKGYVVDRIVTQTYYNVSRSEDSIINETVNPSNKTVCPYNVTFPYKSPPDMNIYDTPVIHDPVFQWIGIACLVLSGILLAVSIWKYQKNKTPKL